MKLKMPNKFYPHQEALQKIGPIDPKNTTIGPFGL